MGLFRRRQLKRSSAWTAIRLETTRLVLVPVPGLQTLHYSGDHAYFQVRESDTEPNIGLAELYYANIAHHSSAVLIDWSFDFGHYNRGFSTEILDALVEDCFTRVGVDEVLVDAVPTWGNVTKANVAIMAGFEQISDGATEVYRKRRE